MKTFDVKIPAHTRSHGGLTVPGFIEPQSVAPEECPISKVLEGLLPGHAIEHTPFKVIGLPPYMWSVNSLFFDTVQWCYANHHALALKPEVIGYLINYAIGIEVKSDPETYRDLFTQSAGREIIRIFDDSLVPGVESNWTQAIGLFDAALRERVPQGLMDEMLPGYTTDTPVTRVASLISFMDAASPFYDYRVRTRCGLPRITLLGETQDWMKLRDAAVALAPRFPTLERFFSRVIPTLTKLVEELNADTLDNEFWIAAFKHYGGSGTNEFDGWLSNFVSHLKDDRTGKFKLRDDNRAIEHGTTGTHVSTVPFIWEYYEQEIPMVFAGGVLDVEIIAGALCPSLSFAVLHQKM